MAKVIVVANWKMHPSSFVEARRLLESTKKALERTRRVFLIMAPPALFLRELTKSTTRRSSTLAFAVQSARAESEGAFTGAISLTQAKDARVAYAIIGHAERRAQGESDTDVHAQVMAALTLRLTPIVCVGEKERTQDGGYFMHVREQLREALVDVKKTQVKKIIIAYEPVWAIGAPQPMAPRDMHEMSIFIRKTLVEAHGAGAMDTRILYGGAIDETNAPAMIREGDIAGFLVGRASADARKISALLSALSS